MKVNLLKKLKYYKLRVNPISWTIIMMMKFGFFFISVTFSRSLKVQINISTISNTLSRYTLFKKGFSKAFPNSKMFSFLNNAHFSTMFKNEVFNFYLFVQQVFLTSAEQSLKKTYTPPILNLDLSYCHNLFIVLSTYAHIVTF